MRERRPPSTFGENELGPTLRSDRDRMRPRGFRGRGDTGKQGAAGSAAAAILASKGRRVLVLEKEKFPRYHIGESLIPYTYFPLQRMGLIEKMKASNYTKKFSVQFVSPDGRASHPFYFF